MPSSKSCINISLLLCLFLAASFIASSYEINKFYLGNGVLLDDGWFSYLSTHSLNWPIKNPEILGGDYFSTHLAGILYVYSFVNELTQLIGFGVPSAVFFCLTQGIIFGVLAVSLYVLIKPRDDNFILCTLAIVLSLVLSFNGVCITFLIFPHIEISIPVFLLAYFALDLHGFKKSSFMILILGLLTREDAGLHYFGLFFLLAIYVFFDRVAGYDWKKYGKIAIACLMYSVMVLFIQKIYFSIGDDALSRIYLGYPIYSHITSDFIVDRLNFYFYQRAYLYIPIFAIAFFSLLNRNFLVLLGIASCLPWVLFSFMGLTALAGTLAYYYAFPVLFGLLWPAICLAYQAQSTTLLDYLKYYSLLAVIGFSSICGYFLTSAYADYKPWRSITVRADPFSIQRELYGFFEFNKINSNFIADESVAALVPDLLRPGTWAYLSNFQGTLAHNVNYVIFSNSSYLYNPSRTKDFLNENGFSHVCNILNTKFYAAFKSGESPLNCADVVSSDSFFQAQ